MKLDGPQQAQLRDLFAGLFNKTDLRSLCMELDLDYEDIPGSTRTEKIQELIAQMNRHGRIEELLKEAKQMRPSADWSVVIPTQALSLFPIHEIAYPSNPNFTGRVDLLEQIEQTLSGGQTAVVTQAISGLGGVGKTQLALAYCYTQLDKYDLIYWLAADNETSLTDSFRSLAQRLKLATTADTDQQAIVQRVLRWLGQAEQRWLLVFDNADQIEPKELATYLPHTGSGHILITSRNPNWRSVGHVLQLNIFSEEEAVAFLSQRAGTTSAKNEDEKNLAATLGYFPLALEHAAAYVEATGSNYATYQQLFETMRQALWAELEEPSSYNATITTTWELAFQQIKQVPGALDLLNLCCFLAPDEIPFDLIIQHAATLPDELAAILEHPLNRDKAVSGLLRYSLIQRKGNELSIHRLVQMVARDRMGKEENLAEIWAQAVILFLSASFVYDEHDMETWIDSQRLLNHIQAIVNWPPELFILPEKTVRLLNKTAEYLSQFGNYKTSQICTQKALEISEEYLGSEHPETAQSLNNFGYLLRLMGDLDAAQPYLERALAIREKTLGSEHPDTAQSLNNLGSILNDMGNLAAGRSYYERALAINEQVLGPEHPDTALVLNNLGVLLHHMRDMAAAQPLYERALAIREKTLGPDHPTTATSLNNLGSLLQGMGNLAAARPYLERALAIKDNALGPDHPDTASSVNNLGGLLLDMGDLPAARPFFESALAIREKALGLDHPDTASSLNNLGGLLRSMGDLTAALSFYERALTIREKALGPNHPDTAASLNNLGSIYLFQGKLVLAREYLERALKIIEQTKGENPPILVKILINLGGIMVKFRKDAIARQYLKRAQTICREAPVPYAECQEAEELWKQLPGMVGKTKGKNKKRRR